MARTQSISLEEALGLFLSSLAPEARRESQQELSRFLQWYGRDRGLEELTPPDLERFVEGAGSAVNFHKLKPLKAFLAFAHKKEFISANLASHVKVSKSSANRKETAVVREAREVVLTPEGHRQLQEQLNALYKERIRVAQDIKRAAADKDFRENAPLDAAREDQGHLEAHIRELEMTLKNVTLIDSSEERPKTTTIGLGSKVTLRNLNTGGEISFTLVDPGEAAALSGKISSSSPIGKAVLRKKEGENIQVETPGGAAEYLILGVES